MLERRIEDYWNIEGDRDPSDSWTGFTRFTSLEEKLSNGYKLSGERLTKKQKSRPDHLWPEMWQNMSDAGQRKEKQKCAIEKPNSTMLEGCEGFISSIRKMKRARKPSKNTHGKRWMFRWKQPCLARSEEVSTGKPAALAFARQNTHASWKPTNLRESVRKELYTKIMKITLQGKGINSLSDYNLVHQFIPMPKAMKIPDAKAAVEKEWATIEKIPAWQLTKVRNKNEVIVEARNEGRKVHFASLMDICHLKNAELETKHQKIQRSSCTPRRHCERWFWILCSIYRTRIISITNDSSKSHGYHIQTARLLRTSSRRSIGLYSSNNGRCSQIEKIPNRNVQTFGFVYHDTNGLNHGPVWKTQSFLLNEICMVILWQDCCGKGNLRTSYWSTVGWRFWIGNAYSYTVKKDCSYLCMWMTWNWLERNKILIRCGNYSTKKSIWENQHLSSIMYTWAALKDNAK